MINYVLTAVEISRDRERGFVPILTLRSCCKYYCLSTLFPDIMLSYYRTLHNDMFIVPNDKVSINSNTCSSKSRNKNSIKISSVKCRNSEVMQLNYKKKERSQEFLVIIVSQKSSFSYILHKYFSPNITFS